MVFQKNTTYYPVDTLQWNTSSHLGTGIWVPKVKQMVIQDSVSALNI